MEKTLTFCSDRDPEGRIYYYSELDGYYCVGSLSRDYNIARNLFLSRCSGELREKSKLLLEIRVINE